LNSTGHLNTIINDVRVTLHKSVLRECQMSHVQNCGDCVGRGSRSLKFPRQLTTRKGDLQAVRETKGCALPARKRRLDPLTSHEREKISGGLANGDSLGMIAHALGMSASTTRREVARNKGQPHDGAADVDDRALSPTRNFRRSAYWPETRCCRGVLQGVCGNTGHRSKLPRCWGNCTRLEAWRACRMSRPGFNGGSGVVLSLRS